MSIEENKAIVLDEIEVWNTGDLDLLEEIIASDYIGHFHSSTEQPESGTEWYKQYVATYRAVYPDLRVTIEDLLVDRDKLVARWTLRGTHRGETGTSLGFAIPPTGKAIAITGITVFRVINGKIAEEWWVWDRLGLLQQLGAIPGAAPPAG